jgi:hypothetical protein
MITVSLPNPVYFAKGLLKPVRFLGVPLQRPLPVSAEDFVDATNEEWYGWLGKPALTSLSLGIDEATAINLTECVMTVTQEKNIVATAIQGRNGTIKEYISDGDYQIEVSAAIQPAGNEFAPPDEYPLEALKQLLELFRKSESLMATSDFLSLFEIYTVVVKSYSFEQETYQNRQSFKLTLLSDAPYEIKLSND